MTTPPPIPPGASDLYNTDPKVCECVEGPFVPALPPAAIVTCARCDRITREQLEVIVKLVTKRVSFEVYTVGEHQPFCNYPDQPCGCGLFDFRADLAAHVQTLSIL